LGGNTLTSDNPNFLKILSLQVEEKKAYQEMKLCQVLKISLRISFKVELRYFRKAEV